MKICSQCGKEKEDSRFEKGRNQCKECKAAYKRGLRKGIRTPREKVIVGERVCECGAKEIDGVEFRSSNQCRPCHRESLKKWREKTSEKRKKHREENRDKINEQKRQTYRNNREHYLTKRKEYYESNKEEIIKQVHQKTDYYKRTQRNYRRWLGKAACNSRSTDKRLGRKCDIDLDYVMEILEQQDFKCAITGTEMAHEFNNLLSASIDRIDNSKGHIKGNIQIVCTWINLAKRHYANEDLIGALDIYYHIRLVQEGRATASDETHSEMLQLEQVVEDWKPNNGLL